MEFEGPEDGPPGGVSGGAVDEGETEADGVPARYVEL